MKLWIRCTAILATALVMMLCLTSQGSAQTASPSPLWKRVCAKNLTTMRSAAGEYRTLRKKTIAGLVDVLESYARKPRTTRLDARERREIDCAIRLLGDMRAESAAPIIAQFLEFSIGTGFGMPFAGSGTITADEKAIRSSYPAVDALIKIGKPSLGPCADRVADRVAEITRERRARLKKMGDKALLFPNRLSWTPVKKALTVVTAIEGKEAGKAFERRMRSGAEISAEALLRGIRQPKPSK